MSELQSPRSSRIECAGVEGATVVRLTIITCGIHGNNPPWALLGGLGASPTSASAYWRDAWLGPA